MKRKLLKKIINKIPYVNRLITKTVTEEYWAKSIIDDLFNHKGSFEKKVPINKSGKPIPWYTYPSIEYLSHLDLNDKDVFEWGCGNSSLFYSSKARKVISVEKNEKWYAEIIKKKLPNNKIFFKQSNDFIDCIKNYPKGFDIIVIDDILRSKCAEIAPKYLRTGGIIILDNSDWHPLACSILREFGLIQVDFSGFGPINKYTWTTSIFFSRDFDMLKSDLQIKPIGGIYNPRENLISKNQW